jgi:dTDP-4-dehydrorhamnose reductase
MKILLLGKNGQIGQAFQELANTDHWPIAWDLISWGRTDGEFSNPDLLVSKITTLKPDVIINAAAFTQVDLAETSQFAAEYANAVTPGKIAEYCVEADIPLIHYSTDYVYAGSGSTPHEETETINPQNIYGLTKARGDEAIIAAGTASSKANRKPITAKSETNAKIQALIFRTSWVYSLTGKNFVLTMKRLGAERERLDVVEDQVGSPSYAPDLAEYSLDALMQAMEKKIETGKFPTGVYHLSNSGYASWAEFARAILPGKTINGIPSSQYQTVAKRPLNSRLSLKKLEETFNIRPRAWTEALVDCLAKVKE